MKRGFKKTKFGCFCVFISLIPVSAIADCDLDYVVGYTLIASKYVDGFYKDGEKKSGFEGCDYDRIIIFDDGTGVRCTTYSYTYSYHPKAYIFSNGSSLKMCVGSSSTLYSISTIR